MKTKEIDLATNGVYAVIKNEDDDNFKNFPVRKFSFQSSPSFIYDPAIEFDLEEISDLNFSEDDPKRTSSHNSPKKDSSKNGKKRKKTKSSPPKISIKKTLKKIIKKRLFILAMLSLCSLYFIITAIQFWISDYMITILNFKKKTVFILFTIISTTAPSLGLTMGGKICTKIGGYTGKHSVLFCLITSFIASLFSMPIPFINNQIIVIILFWFLLFFGASILPALLGIMISSIPQESRNLGNAFAQFMFNLLGYFPSPILYGFVNSLDKKIPSRWGMIMVSFWPLWGVFFLSFAFFKQLQKRRFLKKEEFLLEKQKEYEMTDLINNRNLQIKKDEYVIPLYEDEKEKNKLKNEILLLEEYIKKNKDVYKDI